MNGVNRLLPSGGTNKFQLIKSWMRDAEANGISLIKLSIGQPSGPALLPVREATAKAALQALETVWEYQDNGSPGVPNFAQRFVQAHVRLNVSSLPSTHYAFLPIPGIKPMLQVVIESLGSWAYNKEDAKAALERGETYHPPIRQVYSMTNPGYPTPFDQAMMVKGIVVQHLPLRQENDFLFDVEDLEGLKRGDLIMLNLPHNPTGIVGKRYWLEQLCEFCSARGIRIFNDAAYAILAHTSIAVTLTDVAAAYPDLEWAEAFSASKAGNNTGARVGAMIGSADFMADIAQVKGNVDSGFAAPMAAGVLELFEKHKNLIEEVRMVYERRLSLLIDILCKNGMHIAVEPKAGFFALFNCPKYAFGQEIKSAEQFNRLMVDKTGVVGVHFEPYIRYAICATDIIAKAVPIAQAFNMAEVSY